MADNEPAKLDNPKPYATDEFGRKIDPKSLTAEERIRIQRENARLQELKMKEKS